MKSTFLLLFMVLTQVQAGVWYQGEWRTDMCSNRLANAARSPARARAWSQGCTTDGTLAEKPFNVGDERRPVSENVILPSAHQAGSMSFDSMGKRIKLFDGCFVDTDGTNWIIGPEFNRLKRGEIPATLLWTVTTNTVQTHITVSENPFALGGREKISLFSNLVAHIDWKGKPFETVLESKVFFVTNRNYRLEKQPDRKVYE